jgi:hypothetical protein
MAPISILSIPIIVTRLIRHWCAARCTHGVPFAAAVQKDNIRLTQFHPEKSGDSGLKLLSGWVFGGARRLMVESNSSIYPAIDLLGGALRPSSAGRLQPGHGLSR